MSITTVSSRELNQDIVRAKRAALAGPVFITDRGKPAHVLLCIEDYQRLVGNTGTLAQALALPGVAEVRLVPPKLKLGLRIPEFD